MEHQKKSRKKKNSGSQENNIPKKKNKLLMCKAAEEEEEETEDHVIGLDEHDPENDEKVADDAGVTEPNVRWTTENYMELIHRMEQQIPQNDTLSFTCRSERLDWDKIRFGNFTVEECYEQWRLIKTKVRHFRLLGEILYDAKIWAEKPWSAPLKKKKVRHPDQPTRPLSSFMLFYMEKKNKIIKKNPDLKLTEISRVIGEKYKNLSAEKKNYYIEKAKGMQEEYKEQLAKFYEKHPELIKVSKKPSAQTNRPLPPYKLYLKEKLLKHQKDEDFNQNECIEKYKEMWKSLSYKKKAYWIRKAKEEEEKYLENLREEEGEGDESKPASSYKSVISKEEQSILDRLAGKPEKPPNSAYSLFSRLMLKDKEKHLVDGEPKNRMKEVALMWKELPEDQKKVYAEKVQHMLETYKLEMANYLETLPEDKRAEELAKLQPKKKAPRAPKTIKKPVVPKVKAEDGEELWKNEPKKPPVTAWDLFKTEFVKLNSDMPSKTAYRYAADRWKNLSDKEVEKYKKKHQKLKDKYMADFEGFLATLNEEELKDYSAWKKAKSGQGFGEESLEDDSEEEVEEEEEEEDGGESSSSPDSSDSDSGVSEADA